MNLPKLTLSKRATHGPSHESDPNFARYQELKSKVNENEKDTFHMFKDLSDDEFNELLYLKKKLYPREPTVEELRAEEMKWEKDQGAFEHYQPEQEEDPYDVEDFVSTGQGLILSKRAKVKKKKNPKTDKSEYAIVSKTKPKKVHEYVGKKKPSKEKQESVRKRIQLIENIRNNPNSKSLEKAIKKPFFKKIKDQAKKKKKKKK